MRIHYLYSACVKIETEDCSILCDPWFGEAYDGAWMQWPRIEHPIEACRPADYIYISHIHPDHYDPAFLTAYLKVYPKAVLLIAHQNPQLLGRKLVARGMSALISAQKVWEHGKTALTLIPNANGIDSALLVQCDTRAAINLNDNPYDSHQVMHINDSIRECKAIVGLFPFVGAGPWPQCYEFPTEPLRKQAEVNKRQQYLDLFQQYCQAIQPSIAVPFAGQYWLHGPQIDLNPHRGMADATDCRSIAWTEPHAGKRCWVPADGGQSTLTIETNGTISWNSERKEAYDWLAVRKALQRQDEHNDGRYAYRYEREIHVPVERLPLMKLLESAAYNAKHEYKSGHFLHIYIKAHPLPGWFWIVTDGSTVSLVNDEGPFKKPHYKVTLDARYLFGMLTRLYNANNVRIGSLCQFSIAPMEPFDQERYDLFGKWWDSLRV